MSYKLFLCLILIHVPDYLFTQNVFRILDTERGYPLWNQARNNDGTCNPCYNEKFPNSGNNHCDCGHFWAGCGAIAKGQIMWYWQYPKNYNWEIIPPELHENTPWNNTEQLQQFILDCATNINTHYTTEYSHFKNNEINIYPNPVKDFLYIYSDLNEDTSFEIIDIYGREILFGTIENSKVDVTKLNNGIYYIKIKTTFEIYIFRFIKI